MTTSGAVDEHADEEGSTDADAVRDVVRRIEVSTSYEGERLDRACVALLRDLASEGRVSRASVTRWIREGRVTVDGRIERDPARRARAGDVVTVAIPPPPCSDAVPEAIPLDVLHADEDIVVVDKAAGMVVHPAPGHPRGTLVNALLHWFGTLAPPAAGPVASEGDGTEQDDEDDVVSEERAASGVVREPSRVDLSRPGIVHRLDRWTSGVMVAARTELARERLAAQIAARTVERAYLAIVEGKPPERMRIDTLHGRHRSDRKRFTTRVIRGKQAITHVERLEVLDGASLVRCRLETGRTHQIRVHLAEAGFPLLGDAVYGRTPKDRRVRAAAQPLLDLGRQALHAAVLGFSHPRTGQWLRFETPLPQDLRTTLARLRSESEIALDGSREVVPGVSREGRRGP